MHFEDVKFFFQARTYNQNIWSTIIFFIFIMCDFYKENIFFLWNSNYVIFLYMYIGRLDICIHKIYFGTISCILLCSICDLISFTYFLKYFVLLLCFQKILIFIEITFLFVNLSFKSTRSVWISLAAVNC